MTSGRKSLGVIGASATPCDRGRSPRAAPPSRFVLRYSITAEVRENLCSDLALRSGLAKSRIKEALSKGAVWIKRQRGRRRRVRRATTRLNIGDGIELYYDAAILKRTPPETECIDDQCGFSIWYKPAGMLTQGTHFGDHCSLMRAAQRAFNARRSVFPVHRLDREAQGLVLIAHDRPTAAGLSALFRRRLVEKGYHAELKGRLEDPSGFGTIALPLDGKPAVTRFRVLHHDAELDRTAVEIRLETGRRHQIRRHCNAIGHPVLGDPRYGRDNPEPSGLKLWASFLAFTCPQCRQPHVYHRAPVLAVRADAAHIRNQHHGDNAS